ncbi:hypothetical protein PGO14_18500 [Klebsiella aerogenes]
MKSRFTLCALTLLSLQTSVHAAGFNCALEKLNETEKTICQTPYLSGIDNVANQLFINAVNNTLSKEIVQSGQTKWLKERNSCKADVECIKQKYLLRNSELSSIEAFHSLPEVFPASLLDKPFNGEMKNKNGFVIRDNHWQVKKLFDFAQKERSFDIDSGDWYILTHLIANNNLAIIFTIRGDYGTYLVLISDMAAKSYIIDFYNGDSDSESTPEITLVKRDSSGFTYQVSNIYDATHQKFISKYYKIEVNGSEISKPIAISPPVNIDKEKTWTGYCGRFSCDSELRSPDGQWRLASGEGTIPHQYDGVYYFPHDRPDLGVNVFLSVGDRKEDGWSYSRNYAWGDKNSFFFDNDGGLACIWKTDISQKTTERILPVEGLKYPYYLRYDNEDYVISQYIPTGDADSHLGGFYIARSGQ